MKQHAILILVLVSCLLFTGIGAAESENGTNQTSALLLPVETTGFDVPAITTVEDSDMSNYWAPWVTNTSTTSAIINWWQESQGGGWTVLYANASYYDEHGKFDHAVPDPNPDPANFHHVLLTGLEPNTTYKYLVEPAGSDSPGTKKVFSVRKFQTFPVSGPFTFVVISDTHANEERFRYVADALANESGVLFILHGGDYASHDNASQWVDFFGYGDGMLANYSIYTNIGNHEYHNNTGDHASTEAYEYRNSFVCPLYYSFDCAGIRFVILDSPDPNSTDDQNPTLAHSEAQVSWLKDRLDNNLYGTFVIDHHPVWTYGRASAESALQPWETLFHTYNISADFAGHIHSYQRFSVDGIPYFIVANAGGGFVNLTDGKPYPPSYVCGATKELGYLKVTVDPANNTATANEYFVASVPDYDSTTGTVISPPLLADTITFPLKVNQTPPEPPSIPITAPALISNPGHYRLMNDLSNSTEEVAIWITASDVVLDGDGHTLGGAFDKNTSGVLAGNVPGGLENITLNNLTVTGWESGMRIDGVTSCSIGDTWATGNQEGIYITGSPWCTIRNCTVIDNIPFENEGIFSGGTGINLGDSPGTCILDSTISHNGWGEDLPAVGGYGILSMNTTGLLISGCIITTNVNTGIWNEDSRDTLVLGNQIHGNEGNGGIFMVGYEEDAVINATIADNNISGSGQGICLERNDYLVENNTVKDCGSGILLAFSQNATLIGNIMEDNELNFGVDGNAYAHYHHQIDRSNTVDGRPIYYLVGQSDALVDSTTGAGTVYGISCMNLTIRDLTIENNENGVFLLGSDYAVITNLTALENTIGFVIQECDGTRIESCTALANSLYGFMIQGSEGVRIIGSDSFLNQGGMAAGTGISVENCQDILLSQVNVSENNFAGIDLEDTGQATLVDVTAGSNGAVGIVLSGDTIQVTGCHIRDNQGPGIGMLDSTNVMIWNNFFSNDVNVDLTQGLVTGSSWNTAKTAGPNIAGGPYLGGNYWATPDGTGWSQVTPDRGDGFCNAPYILDGTNIDLLPLHIRTLPPLYADFTADPMSGNASLTVNFTDKSSPNVVNWSWVFGDGGTSTLQNPSHEYINAGEYTATLTVCNNYGCSAKSVPITVLSTCPTGGCIPIPCPVEPCPTWFPTVTPTTTTTATPTVTATPAWPSM